MRFIILRLILSLLFFKIKESRLKKRKTWGFILGPFGLYECMKYVSHIYICTPHSITNAVELYPVFCREKKMTCVCTPLRPHS